ncbi:hypothetical protein [Hydrogenophaga sp. ZJX-1]
MKADYRSVFAPDLLDGIWGSMPGYTASSGMDHSPPESRPMPFGVARM